MSSESTDSNELRNGADMQGHVEHSPYCDSSIHDVRAPVQRTEVHDHGSKSDARLALILASGALFGLLVSLFALHFLWTEYRLADLHLRDMKAAMIAHGMDPNPHMPKESP
jgi:hypothetical protein